MNKNEAANQIENMFEGIADVKIGHHANLRHFGFNEAKRGCYVEIRERYAEPVRLYAASYAALVIRARGHINS